MRLEEALETLRGKPAYIPDCSRLDLPRFFWERGYRVGAEIGVYKGAFTAMFCRVGMKMYAIDPWHSYNGNGRAFQKQERQEFLYEHTCRTLEPYQDCTIIRKTSMDAVKYFQNHSLDFVYIDGDHNFKAVAEDVYEWTWKVRPGGIVAGHDYFCTMPTAKQVIVHVGPVIDAYTKAFGIDNWYTFGTEADRYASWMWVR